MADTLYDLVDQLTGGGPSGKKLRRQFHDSPESVTEDLVPGARKALYTMDQSQASAGGQISSYVLTEFQAEGRGDEHPAWEAWFVAWRFPIDEFVPQGKLPPECRYEGQAYPNPQPLVYDITPRAVSFAAGGPVEVTVVGQGFVSGRTRLELRQQGTNTQLGVRAEFSGIEGSFRCGHLYAKVALPAGPVNAAQVYDIRILITTGTDQLGTPVELGPLPVRKEMGQTIVFTINP